SLLLWPFWLRVKQPVLRLIAGSGKLLIPDVIMLDNEDISLLLWPFWLRVKQPVLRLIAGSGKLLIPDVIML
ncbi:hypothetical protein CQA14_26880, partial [Escherichia coli]